MPYIQNLLSTRLLLRGGYIELAPGECKLITDLDVSTDSVVYALKAGQVKAVEDPSKADPAPPPLPPIESSAFEMAPSLSAEQLQAFLAAKNAPPPAPEPTPEPVVEEAPAEPLPEASVPAPIPEPTPEVAADPATPARGRPKKTA